MKNKNEKEVLDVLSNVIRKDTPNVWVKIKNNEKSRFSDIECESPNPIKYKQTFSFRKISAIAAACVIIAGIYLSLHYGGGISKIFEKNQKMALDPRVYITQINNTLYYQDFTDDCKLYSMDLNGGNRKKLCDDYVVDLVTDGEYIYYENLNDEKEYRIKTDGTNRELLANIRGWNLNALGDSIYFSSEDGVYSVKKDGSRLKKLSSISQPYTLWLYQNKIYFFASSDGCIYAMNLDGSNFQKILNNCAHEFRISNGYIFFQRYDDKYMPYLFKANLDGTGVKKLSDYAFTTETFDLNKNNIFFTSSSKDHTDALYKMEFDGSNIKRLAELESTTIRVMGEWVYCYQPWGELYKVDIDGKTKVKMLQKYK